MTYKEFMEWVEKDKDLNKRFRRVLSEEIMEEGVDRILSFFTIYPKEYTHVPYAYGCFEKDGEWHHYSNGERPSIEPSGSKLAEDECFDTLKGDLLYELKNYEKEKLQSDNCSYEEMVIREEKERVEKYEDSILYLFLEENRGVKIQENIEIDFNKLNKLIDDVEIDSNKLYEIIDDNDEGDEDYKFAKYAYVRDHGQDKGIQLFKIYKYMHKMGQIMIKRQGSVPNECNLILMRMGYILADMINGRI